MENGGNGKDRENICNRGQVHGEKIEMVGWARSDK